MMNPSKLQVQFVDYKKVVKFVEGNNDVEL